MIYSDFVNAHFKRLDTVPLSILHAAVGISGEVAELDMVLTREDFIEEAGDLWFYLTQAKRLWRESATEDRNGAAKFGMPLTDCFAYLRQTAGEFLDLAKKIAVYNRPLDADWLEAADEALWGLESSLQTLLHFFGLTVEEIEEANTQKLRKRYPEGYSDQAANERKDKQ